MTKKIPFEGLIKLDGKTECVFPTKLGEGVSFDLIIDTDHPIEFDIRCGTYTKNGNPCVWVKIGDFVRVIEEGDKNERLFETS